MLSFEMKYLIAAENIFNFHILVAAYAPVKNFNL